MAKVTSQQVQLIEKIEKCSIGETISIDCLSDVCCDIVQAMSTSQKTYTFTFIESRRDHLWNVLYA